MISVIIPVYNNEGYLPRCLDSIISQTYKDLEIILVDDGSTDHSGAICDTYGNKDRRIRVFHTSNRGVSEARNKGLEMATGDYIQFVDNDDVLHPQMIETLFRLINTGDYDFSMCYGKKVYRQEDIETAIHVPIKESNIVPLSSDSCMRDLYISHFHIEVQYHWVWNKLYKRELLGNIRFVKDTVEDVVFNNSVYQLMENAILVTEPMYYWVQLKTSLSHSGNYESMGKDLNSYMRCLSDIPFNNLLFRSYCLRKLYRMLLSSRYWSRGTKSSGVIELLSKTIYNQTKKEFRSNSYIPFGQKIILQFFLFCPCFYSFLMTVNEMWARRRW